MGSDTTGLLKAFLGLPVCMGPKLEDGGAMGARPFGAWRRMLSCPGLVWAADPYAVVCELAGQVGVELDDG